jgi:hypothetical protein
MKARQLFHTASYGPEQLRLLFEAFDQAWEVVVAEIGDDPAAIEATRIKLANIILGLASQEDKDAAWLKKAALQLLRGGNPTLDLPPRGQ